LRRIVSSGYDDWYLPAENEMKDLTFFDPSELNLYALGYWTSTEIDNAGAKAFHRNYNSDPLLLKPEAKIKQLNMVCIREK